MGIAEKLLQRNHLYPASPGKQTEARPPAANRVAGKETDNQQGNKWAPLMPKAGHLGFWPSGQDQSNADPFEDALEVEMPSLSSQQAIEQSHHNPAQRSQLQSSPVQPSLPSSNEHMIPRVKTPTDSTAPFTAKDIEIRARHLPAKDHEQQSPSSIDNQNDKSDIISKPIEKASGLNTASFKAPQSARDPLPLNKPETKAKSSKETGSEKAPESNKVERKGVELPAVEEPLRQVAVIQSATERRKQNKTNESKPDKISQDTKLQLTPPTNQHLPMTAGMKANKTNKIHIGSVNVEVIEPQGAPHVQPFTNVTKGNGRAKPVRRRASSLRAGGAVTPYGLGQM